MFSEESEEPGEKKIKLQIWLLLKNSSGHLGPFLAGAGGSWCRGHHCSLLPPTEGMCGLQWLTSRYPLTCGQRMLGRPAHLLPPVQCRRHTCSVQSHTASTSAFAFPLPTLGWHLPCPLAVAPLLCCFCFLSGRQVAELPTNPPAGGG